ncbi:MAG: asparagine synthase (glutamine-hydrolyzing), partial [Proteobacteria bacterium]|nr:asparagine synthase (glutamine-hydrolyzing) [Pseudomonadota bacterium]
MIAAMHHRGPDGQGQFDAPRASIGMARLAIQDVSAWGDQPMANDDQSIWIVYNGELYNGPAERVHLQGKGYRFRSTGDTEVVLKLYQEYGEACLPRLRGIFALAIIDLRGGPGRERYLLARDAMGVKPLLYSQTKRGIVFASELKAILESGLVERRVDGAAVRSLLFRGSVYQPASMIKGVEMLPPAHVLIQERGQTRIERYWTFATDRRTELKGLGYGEQVEAMRELMRETVKAQLVSDVPVGAFLSGGVDSAALVALMASEAAGRVKTFSVGFDESLRAIDETGEAGAIAAHLGTDHHRVAVDGAEIAENFDKVVMALDQPSVDGLNSYLVSRAAAAHVKVAISGTGGDDLFMGYPWHAKVLAQPPAPDRFLDAYAGYNAEFHQTFGDGDVGHLLAPKLRNAMREPASRGILQTDELPDGGAVDRMTVLTLRGYTNNQLLRDIDAMSMAHSLEVRVPYLDVEMINFALSLPVEARIAKPIPDDPMRNSYRASGIKRILIDAARPLLPEGFDTVPKRGFGMPFNRWVQGPMKDLAEASFDERRAANHGVLDRRMMPQLRQTFEAGRLSGWRVWLLMVLQRWLELNKVTG